MECGKVDVPRGCGEQAVDAGSADGPETAATMDGAAHGAINAHVVSGQWGQLSPWVAVMPGAS